MPRPAIWSHATRFPARFALMLLCVLFTSAVWGQDQDTPRLSVMTLNMALGAAAFDPNLEASERMFRTAKADIIGIQEAANLGEDGTGQNSAIALANRLGWDYYDQSRVDGLPGASVNNIIMSRFDITGSSPRGYGAKLNVAGRDVYVFNVHLSAAPYQPYQLVGIEYFDAPFINTERAAIRYANDGRREDIRKILADIQELPEDATVIVTGDFNEPSHRDWTEEAVTAGYHPIAVSWPTTQALEAVGFVDTYRNFHPNEAQR